jgi:hypothetical protein
MVLFGLPNNIKTLLFGQPNNIKVCMPLLMKQQKRRTVTLLYKFVVELGVRRFLFSHLAKCSLLVLEYALGVASSRIVCLWQERIFRRIT